MALENRADVLAWLGKANSDLVMADFALDAGMPDQAGFHAQQAAEKALKSLLVFDERFVPRTHDLPVLLDPLRQREQLTDSFVRQISLLSQYGVGPSYPDFEEISLEHARAAVTFARELVAKVRGHLRA